MTKFRKVTTALNNSGKKTLKEIANETGLSEEAVNDVILKHQDIIESKQNGIYFYSYQYPS